MNFDTTSYMAAIEPPTFTHNGVTWRGRLLSVPEYIRMEQLIDPIRKGADLLSLQSAYKEITDYLFPPPTRQTRRFWSFWRTVSVRDTERQSCWDVLSTLPMPVQTEAIKSFIDSLAAASRLEAAPAVPGKVETPPKKRSRTRTRPATAAPSSVNSTSTGSLLGSATFIPASGSTPATEPQTE